MPGSFWLTIVTQVMTVKFAEVLSLGPIKALAYGGGRLGEA